MREAGSSTRRIYAVDGLHPEVSAHAQARFSRSSRSFRENVEGLTREASAEFLELNRVKYGHASIADMAPLTAVMEQISIWAALEIEDEQLWAGQERSTRYQDFRRTGFYVPEGAGESYAAIARELFRRYEETSAALLPAYRARYPKPEDMGDSAYAALMRARAFDVARYWLPLATHTSLAQTTSARTVERQIPRLLNHPLPEIRAIASELRAALSQQPPFSPTRERLRTLLGVLSEALPAASDRARGVLAEALGLLEPVPVAPTLIRYAQPNPYLADLDARLREIAAERLGALAPDADQPVVLHTGLNPVEEAVASLLYPYTHASLGQILEVVRRMTPAERERILSCALAGRGSHDEMPRALQSAPLLFDITLDIGAYRDLHRHRRCVQLRQPFTWKLGFETPEPLSDLAPHLLDGYRSGMREVLGQVADLAAREGEGIALYLLPMATRTRCLFKMDIAQADYIITLRTRSQGHFSYRRVAFLMYRALEQQMPALARHIRVTDPDREFNPFLR